MRAIQYVDKDDAGNVVRVLDSQDIGEPQKGDSMWARFKAEAEIAYMPRSLEQLATERLRKEFDEFQLTELERRRRNA